MRLEFTVYGVPQPQGSAKAFVPKGWKRAVITSDNAKLKPWRQEVACAAAEALKSHLIYYEWPTVRPVNVICTFAFQKPKSTKKSVTHKITKPDIDKLLRGVLDAMTGVVFVDDAQVISVRASKKFSLTPGAFIAVESV